MPIAWLYQRSFLWLSKTSAAGGFSIRTGSSGSVKTPANATAYGYKKIADYATGICKTASNKHRKGWAVFFVKRA
jgi:hypothetical protein